MNSNYGKGPSGSLNNFNFDFGIGTGGPKSLNDQRKNQTSSGYSSSNSSSTTTTTTQPKPAWKPNKPSWTHQPAPTGLNGPNSMAGDILGKTWNSTGSGSGIGIVGKNPNLFGDLVNSALGQGNKGSGNVPLKNAASKGPYSMGNLAESLPKSGNSAKSSGNWGSNDSLGGLSAGYNINSSNVKARLNKKSANLGGPSMKSMNEGVASGNGDPFGSLVDFGSKERSGSLNSASKDKKANAGFQNDDGFGNFLNVSRTSTTAFKSGGFSANNSSNFSGTNIGSNSNLDDIGVASKDSASRKQLPVQNSGGDPLDMFSSFSSGSATTASKGMEGQQFSGVDDWGLRSEFEGSGNDGGGATTELEGLPPPPAGITASAAKNKGMDHQRQGQYADAIKWLSWAIVLLDKAGDEGSTMEVLSCRASCYKEVGEYKKAVADCSKVLEHDEANVSVLVQRALLYESMEKYKLGAEDLRNVLKIDPVNRIARSTIHRLTQMAS